MDVTFCATQKSSLPSCILSRVLFLFCHIILLLFIWVLEHGIVGSVWDMVFGFSDFSVLIFVLSPIQSWVSASVYTELDTP